MSFFFTRAYSACSFSGRLLVLFVFPSSIAASAGSMGSYWFSGWLEWLLKISTRQKIVVNRCTYVKACDSWHWVSDLKVAQWNIYRSLKNVSFIKRIFNNHVRESAVIPVARKILLITTCISLISPFMTSTPSRPLRVCVLSATLVGHWTACSIVCVVDFFIGVLPNSVFAFLFVFLSFPKYCHSC